MSDQDKRYKERYDLELPFTVRWKDRSGRTRQANGTTKNMSPLGAYLVCDSPIGDGCVIDICFDKPVALGGCIPSRISATGTILRDVAGIEHAAVYGHRVKFERFSFTRLDGQKHVSSPTDHTPERL
jgi:hypothetical protein